MNGDCKTAVDPMSRQGNHLPRRLQSILLSGHCSQSSQTAFGTCESERGALTECPLGWYYHVQAIFSLCTLSGHSRESFLFLDTSDIGLLAGNHAMILQYARKKLVKGTIEIWSFAKDTVQSFLEDNALRLAASLAFYTTFSITPALLIGLSVAGALIGNTRAESELTAAVGRLINPEAAEYVFSLVGRFSEELQGSHLRLVGIVGALVAATAVFVDLQSALNVIWQASLRNRQGWLGIIRSRAISFVFVVGIGILLLISVVTSAVLATINSLFMKALPIPEELYRWLRILAQFGMVPLLLATTYKLVPDADIEWKDVLVGAIITSVLFLLGKSAFGMYLSMGILGSVYGAAGSLFILLAWVYYSAQVFFLGAEMTKVYAMRYGSRSKAGQKDQEAVA